MHIHIATVGVTPSIISDVITGVGMIDRVYLLPSEDTVSYAETIKDEFPRMDIRIKKVLQYDFMDVLNTIYDIKKDVEEEFENNDRILHSIRYSINITGGRKLMITAAAVASIYLRADMYYKVDPSEGRFVEESIIKVDKLSIFDDSKFSNKNK